MSGPRPHTEPTRNKLVGIAIYGPALLHCRACASSLRVASFDADMDPIYTQYRRGMDLKIAKPLHETLGGCINSWVADFFPRSRPTVNVALRPDHGAYVFGVFDDPHFEKLFAVRRHPIS